MANERRDAINNSIKKTSFLLIFLFSIVACLCMFTLQYIVYTVVYIRVIFFFLLFFLLWIWMYASLLLSLADAMLLYFRVSCLYAACCCCCCFVAMSFFGNYAKYNVDIDTYITRFHSIIFPLSMAYAHSVLFYFFFTGKNIDRKNELMIRSFSVLDIHNYLRFN